MKRMHETDPGNAGVAAGFKLAAAVVVIGVLLAVGTNFVPADESAHRDEPGAQRPDSTFEYFPSGYELQATMPEAPVQAF